LAVRQSAVMASLLCLNMAVDLGKSAVALSKLRQILGFSFSLLSKFFVLRGGGSPQRLGFLRNFSLFLPNPPLSTFSSVELRSVRPSIYRPE